MEITTDRDKPTEEMSERDIIDRIKKRPYYFKGVLKGFMHRVDVGEYVTCKCEQNVIDKAISKV